MIGEEEARAEILRWVYIRAGGLETGHSTN